MSISGGGKFINFESNQNWDMNDMLVTPKVVPWSLKEFLVYNLNAGFCLDGRVDVDSDIDGMCDRDEVEMNRIYADELEAEGKSFDPANRFSFGDGYGDFFHWLRFRYGANLASCTDRSDEDSDLLTACEESEIYREDEDGKYLTSDPKNFDTDKDGIIDGIETFLYFTLRITGGITHYTAALDPDNLHENSPDGEGTVLEQLRGTKALGLRIWIALDMILRSVQISITMLMIAIIFHNQFYLFMKLWKW